MEEEPHFKARVFGVYNINTNEISLTVDQKELGSVLKRAKLAMDDIKTSFVELKLYNNENNLYGNIMQVSTNTDPEGQHLIRVKLEKNEETDDDLINLFSSQKSAQKKGGYWFMNVRIHSTIQPAYVGDIIVEKKTPDVTPDVGDSDILVGKKAPAIASMMESTEVESGPDDQYLAVLTEVLKDTGYVAHRKGQRHAELRRYAIFSDVVLRADGVTGTNEMVVTIRQQNAIPNLIDNVGNTAFNFYKAVFDRRRDIADLIFGKRVSSSQAIVDAAGEIKYAPFEDVAKNTEKLWHRHQAYQDWAYQDWTEARGGTEVDPAGQPYDKPSYPVVKPYDKLVYLPFLEMRIKHQGRMIGKGVVTDFEYDNKSRRIEMTIAKIKVQDKQQYVLDGRMFTGEVMMIHREAWQEELN